MSYPSNDVRSSRAPGAADLPDKTRPTRGASLRRLLSLARGEAGLLAWGTALLALGSLAGLLYPQGMREVIDTALGQGGGPDAAARAARLDLVALAMGAIALVQGAAIAGRYVIFSIVGERIVTRLRERLYRAILDQEIGFFDAERTGDLTSRLGADTSVLQSAVSANVSMGLRNLAQAIGGIGFLVWTSPVLAALMLAVVPALAVSAVAYGRRVRRLSKEVQDALAETSAVAEESIAGVRTVRSFAAEEKEAARYGRSLWRSFDLARTRAKVTGSFIGAVSFGAYLAAALVFWYGGRLVARGEMTAGGLTSFLVYTLLVGVSLGGLADLWADFMKSIGAAGRVFELIDRTPAIPPSGGVVLARVEGGLALEGVSFAYPSRPDVPVLERVDLAVAPGEIVALVGPSGAGKSTLAALLARFYDPAAGRLLLDGHDLRTLDPGWLRRQIGAVAQEPILFSTSVAENIRYGRPEATDAEVEQAARVANADEFVRRFPQGYGTLVGERGVQLSGGQKQRIAIARAVLKDPRVLVLDEATSALDAESEHLVKEALDRLMRGRTTIVIAHRLSTVIDADRVVVLEGGRVVQAGSHRALMSEEGLYRRLVERQFVAA